MIRVTCPYCQSSGYISPPPPRTILMGPCPVCGEAVALYNSKVIGLKRRMQETDGTFGEKIQSLARIIMEYINSQGGTIEDTELEQIIHGTGNQLGPKADESRSQPTPHVAPSIKNPPTSPISSEETRDFLKIDLNLLAKKEYFDKFFG